MNHFLSFCKASIAATALLLAFSFCTSSKSGHLTIKEPWSDGMVLQQNASALIRGKALPQGKVIVTTSWDRKMYATTADDSGVWSISVNTPSASYDKHRVLVKSEGELLSIKDILVGEVWIAGGQSNMEMPLAGYFNSPVEGYEELLTLPSMEDKVRMFTVGVTESFEPQDFFRRQGSRYNLC